MQNAPQIFGKELAIEAFAPLSFGATPTPGCAHCGHTVQFYEGDSFLARSVADFAASGLENGEAVLIIATPAHREQIEARLAERNIDLAQAQALEQYVPLDAADTLSRFMIDGSPNERLFRQIVGGLIKRCTASGAALRAFGEMVQLLWSEGNGPAAIRLEQLWNNLANQFSFSLLCAYKISGFPLEAHGPDFAQICREHGRVLPAESFSEKANGDEQLRAIALLQQRAAALEAEIAERKAAEAKLAGNQRELENFLENAGDGIHRVAPDGTILWANRAELDLLGYSPDEYIGHSITEFHADPPVIRDILNRLSCGEKLRNYEARMKCRDGSIRYVSISSTVYREHDRFLHTQCITRDITERKLAHQILENAVAERTAELEEKVAELEAFSYSISHDMRSPLRAMQGYAKSLLEDYRDKLDEEAIARLDRIERSSTRLDMLVRDVLAYAKIARGNAELRPVPLKPLLEDILYQDPAFQEARACVSIDEVTHTVIGHDAYLAQCLSNLLSNALKFVPDGARPQVRVQSERVGDNVRVTVSDNGIGIHTEHRDRMFRMFGRVYSDKKYPGTGIGLAIVKKAVQRMGGEIGFDSEPGHGTRFWFTLQAPKQ